MFLLFESISSSDQKPRHAKVRALFSDSFLCSICLKTITSFWFQVVRNWWPVKTSAFSYFFLQVVSNIPFNISTDVVKQLLPMGDVFSEVVLLLQVRISSSLIFTFKWPSCISVLYKLYENPVHKMIHEEMIFSNKLYV